MTRLLQDDEDDGLSDSTFRFGAPSLKLCPPLPLDIMPPRAHLCFRASTSGNVRSMREVLALVQTQGGQLE
jgi:hypothetical protein